jgi:hypothetical protein
MRFGKKVIYSALISAGALLASIMMRITPCRIAPRVPNPVYKWKMCSLNPDQISSSYSINEFFGYTSSMTEAYMITIFLAFIISYIVLHFFTRKKD